MRYNPCGRVVATMRAGYRTECRFWKDSDETATIRWYRALPNAPLLGQVSAITPLGWQPFPWMAKGVGEVFNAEKPFDRGNPIAAATGKKVCGTESDFAEGGVYDPNPPFMNYNTDGLAACCAPKPGAILLGGSARTNFDLKGVVIGGTFGKPHASFFSCDDALLNDNDLEPDGTLYQVLPYSDTGVTDAWNQYRFLGSTNFQLIVRVFDSSIRLRVYTGPIVLPVCTALTLISDTFGGEELNLILPPAPLYRLFVRVTRATPFTLPWQIFGLQFF